MLIVILAPNLGISQSDLCCFGLWSHPNIASNVSRTIKILAYSALQSPGWDLTLHRSFIEGSLRFSLLTRSWFYGESLVKVCSWRSLRSAFSKGLQTVNQARKGFQNQRQGKISWKWLLNFCDVFRNCWLGRNMSPAWQSWPCWQVR